ncbi:MAG: hypothetical protein LCI00_25440 [Chloroflexi bacterium]|nr:hypothetical protein [Chloroflexota bacterium]
MRITTATTATTATFQTFSIFGGQISQANPKMHCEIAEFEEFCDRRKSFRAKFRQIALSNPLPKRTAAFAVFAAFAEFIGLLLS